MNKITKKNKLGEIFLLSFAYKGKTYFIILFPQETCLSLFNGSTFSDFFFFLNSKKFILFCIVEQYIFVKHKNIVKLSLDKGVFTEFNSYNIAARMPVRSKKSSYLNVFRGIYILHKKIFFIKTFAFEDGLYLRKKSKVKSFRLKKKILYPFLLHLFISRINTTWLPKLFWLMHISSIYIHLKYIKRYLLKISVRPVLSMPTNIAILWQVFRRIKSKIVFKAIVFKDKLIYLVNKSKFFFYKNCNFSRFAPTKVRSLLAKRINRKHTITLFTFWYLLQMYLLIKYINIGWHTQWLCFFFVEKDSKNTANNFFINIYMINNSKYFWYDINKSSMNSDKNTWDFYCKFWNISKRPYRDSSHLNRSFRSNRGRGLSFFSKGVSKNFNERVFFLNNRNNIQIIENTLVDLMRFLKRLSLEQLHLDLSSKNKGIILKFLKGSKTDSVSIKPRYGKRYVVASEFDDNVAEKTQTINALFPFFKSFATNVSSINTLGDHLILTKIARARLINYNYQKPAFVWKLNFSNSKNAVKKLI